MFFKYFERNYYVQYSRFNVQRAEARHAADPATADPRQPAKAGRKSQRQAERAAEVSHRAFELGRPGFVPGLFFRIAVFFVRIASVGWMGGSERLALNLRVALVMRRLRQTHLGIF